MSAAAVAPLRGPRLALALVGLAAAYVLAGKLGLSLALIHPSATAVWPPTGISLAALLAFGFRLWPAVFAGAFLVNLTTAGTIATSLGIATGNTLEAVVGAWLVNRFANGRHAFDRAIDTFRYAILAGMVGTAVSATLGVASLALGGAAPWADFGRIWGTWWLGDMGGCLVVAPPLLLWSQAGRLRWNRRAALEAAILFAALLVLGGAVFGPLQPFGDSGYPLKFVCIPVLVWVAFRFDQRTTATATLVFSAISVLGTIANTGPAGTLERNQSLQVLQMFLAVTAATTLVLAATVAERARVEAQMRALTEELRSAMAELEAFSHALSHDLASPISAVLQYATALEQDARARQDTEGLRALGGLRGSAQAVVHVLAQLRTFDWLAREERGVARVDMTALARAAYAEVGAGGESQDGVRFELRDLPPARGNAALLGRVFANLLSNALKYTRRRPDRYIVVSGENGGAVNTYRVADNGIGFDPAIAGSLFKPFQRARKDRDAEGSGLGLTIVARIIRKHGGDIRAESDGVSGAQFTFTLPREPDGGVHG
jgi:signal transduction histidine kinase